MFPTFWKCRNISSIIQMYFCSCQKLNCSYILKIKMFPTFWKCRNISYIFPMCFCSCQKLNCSVILKMQKCFLHFGCRNISSIFKCVSAASKAWIVIPTFWKWRNISSNFSKVFLQLRLCRWKLESFLSSLLHQLAVLNSWYLHI